MKDGKEERRERETETGTEREGDRQTKAETGRDRDGQTEQQNDRQAEQQTKTDIQSERQKETENEGVKELEREERAGRANTRYEVFKTSRPVNSAHCKWTVRQTYCCRHQLCGGLLSSRRVGKLLGNSAGLSGIVGY